MDGLLTFEHGEVRLGNKLVPGVMKSQRIGGAVRFDETERDGLSGKAKTPMGWEDCAITLTVVLDTDEDGQSCYTKLAELDALFRGHDNGVNPRVLDVANPHVMARGIERVVFSRLDSSEDNQSDAIKATLGFTEHRPPIVRAEQRAVTTEGGRPASTATNPGLDPAIGERSR